MTIPFKLSVNNDSDNLSPYSDKANLPPTVLSQIIDEGVELPHPFVFKITNDSDPFIYTYIGVKEFISEPKEIDLPSLVTAKLQNPTTVILELQRDIPKATSLKLKPSLFYPISNWKFFLESRLTHYTLVEKGDTIIIEEGGLKYELQVEEINGSDSVTVASIIDTDVTVDMVPLNDNVAQQQLEFNKSHYDQFSSIQELKKEEEVVIHELSSFINPRFVPRLYKIDISNWSGDNLWIELETNDPTHLVNADCVVGESKLLTIENFAYSSMAEDEKVSKLVANGIHAKKTIRIDFKRDELILNKLNRCRQLSDTGEGDDRYLYLIPFTWQGDETVLLRIADKQDDRDFNITSDSKKCPNCSKLIPKENFLLHESRCPLKQKVKPVNSKLMQFKHIQLYEKQYQCCSQTFDTFFDLVRHKAVCPNKVIECRFCHLIVPQELATYQDNFEGLTHHENLCGNKTQECIKCSKLIRRKDATKHMQLHDYEKAEINQSITFKKCSNVNCINEAGSNELNLCELCFGPLYIAQFDPTNIKLQSRIERKYMLQLTKGCDQVWCNNEHCKAGNPRLNNNSMKDSMTLIQQLFNSIHQPRLPINEKNGVAKEGETKFWFCVNESVSKKKLWFDILKSEGDYTEVIILQALKLNNDESLVRHWLKDNAIARG